MSEKNEKLYQNILEKQGDLLYTTLSEECAELIQACSKIKRHKYFKEGFEIDNLLEEINDVELNMELIKEALKLGFNISFAGPVTFKNSKNVKECLDLIPLNRLQIETDAPYLSPEPFRGTRNNSINMKLTAQKIADLKEISLEELAKVTYENTLRIFEKVK